MFLLVFFSAINILCSGQPMKESGIPVSDLKFTFGSADEIPAAFSADQRRNQPGVYSACQDGSGGLCVELGKCPPNLRPQTNSTNACPSGLECCFGPPADDTSCRSRGGECVAPSVCGRAPVFREATDCGSGQVCCIFV